MHMQLRDPAARHIADFSTKSGAAVLQMLGSLPLHCSVYKRLDWKARMSRESGSLFSSELASDHAPLLSMSKLSAGATEGLLAEEGDLVMTALFTLGLPRSFCDFKTQAFVLEKENLVCSSSS